MAPGMYHPCLSGRDTSLTGKDRAGLEGKLQRFWNISCKLLIFGDGQPIHVLQPAPPGLGILATWDEPATQTRFRHSLSLIEQRDAALCHVWRQLSWAIWLEGSLEHSGELWAQLLPEALVELVWQAIKAWCLAPRQGAEGLSEVLERNAAISSCSLSLLLLCWSQVAVDSCKECILGVERCLRWCKEALWCVGAVVCLQGLRCLLRALEAVQCDCLQRLCGCVELRDGRLSLALSGEMVEPEGGLPACWSLST